MTAARLAALHARATTTGRAWSAAEFAALLADPAVLCIRTDHCFVLGRVVLDEAEILTLATDPDHRRQGHAARALATFEAAARDKGSARVLLDVAADNDGACALYRGAGYRTCGRRRGYYARAGKPAADAIVMDKSIAPT